MRGSPRSLFLSAANRALIWWQAAAKAALKRQQTASLRALVRGKPTRRRRKSR